MIVECHCSRCGRVAPADVPWRGYRVLWRAWIGVTVFLALVSPIIITDLVFMLPLTTVFLFGGSSLRRMAQVEPSCRRCGLTVQTPPVGA